MKRAGLAFLVIALLAILATPLATEAQSAGKVYWIGYLSLGSPSNGVSRPFRDTLLQLGYVEGRTVLIETRFADARVDQLPGLAADLVQRNVDVIVTIGTPPVKAAKDATATIPIVMAGSADPVEHGLVASLARPGANVTGVTHSPGPQIATRGLATRFHARSQPFRPPAGLPSVPPLSPPSTPPAGAGSINGRRPAPSLRSVVGPLHLSLPALGPPVSSAGLRPCG